jgi:hypothetical protein
MEKVKLHFAEVTTKEVAVFHEKIKALYKEYVADGPGAEETTLKDGDIKLLDYKE